MHGDIRDVSGSDIVRKGRHLEKETFTEEVRRGVYEAQNGRCKVCTHRIDDFHHRLSNSRTNRKLFPNFLQSPFNCVGLCRGCHDSSAICNFKITYGEAAMYESYLEGLGRVADEKEIANLKRKI